MVEGLKKMVNVPDLMLFVNEHVYDPFKFEKIKNKAILDTKPVNGLWLSSYNKDVGSYWMEWCKQEEWHQDGQVGSLLKIKDKSRIFIIDNLDDLKTLNLFYGIKSNYGNNSYYLNFETISRDYDGIYLTKNGERETDVYSTYMLKELETGFYKFKPRINLCGWECECLLVFNPEILEFVKTIKIKKKWTIKKEWT